MNPELPPAPRFGDHQYAIDGQRYRPQSRWRRRLWSIAGWIVFTFVIAVLFLVAFAYGLMARDLDGHYAQSNPALHDWFDHLASPGRGLCCSFADGRTIDDPDIDMNGSHYRVRIDGQWIDVPDDAVITAPNKYGRAVVWPYQDENGVTQIRCFMPGAGM